MEIGDFVNIRTRNKKAYIFSQRHGYIERNRLNGMFDVRTLRKELVRCLYKDEIRVIKPINGVK